MKINKGVYIDYSSLDYHVVTSLRQGVFITNNTVGKVAKKFMQKVVHKTPVLTGRARAGWYKAIVGLGASWKAQGNNENNQALGRAEGSFTDKKDRYKRHIIVENKVPYIQKLEYGWSKQAPSGMVRLTIMEFQKTLTSELLAGYVSSWKGKGVRISKGTKHGKSSGYTGGYNF